MNRLWKKLVKLYHPDRFAHEPDKLATYEKLTAAINRAKDNGDVAALREIAEDRFGLEDIFLAATRRAPGEGRRS